MTGKRKALIVFGSAWIVLFLSALSIYISIVIISVLAVCSIFFIYELIRLNHAKITGLIAKYQFQHVRAGEYDIMVDAMEKNLINLRYHEDAYFNSECPNYVNPNSSVKWAAWHKAKLLEEQTGQRAEERIPDPVSNDEVIPGKQRVNPVISRITDYRGNDRVTSITEKQLPDVLEKMLESGNVRVIGNSGSGKTTLIHRLLPRLQDIGDIVVIDAHGYDNQYPGIEVIGKGLNYNHIEHTMKCIIQECKDRYADPKYNGDPNVFDPILVIIDEFASLSDEMPETHTEFMNYVCKNFRKANIYVYLFSQLKDLKSWGVKNQGSMIERLDCVTLLGEHHGYRALWRYGNTKKEIECSTGTSDNRLECQHDMIAHADMPERDIMNADEKTVLEMFDNGESRNEIQRQVYGQRSPKYANIVNGILKQHGRI